MNRSARCGCVLLADSHAEMLGAVRGLLEATFEAVVMVGDAVSLLAAIPRVQPDLVVVDLSLPVAGGRHIVQQLGERFPALRVLVLSVHSEAEAARAARGAGAAGYVLKRTAVTDLAEAIHTVLGGGTYVSAAVDHQPE